MYVCLCKGITDHQIRSAIDSGATSIRQLRDSLGVMTQCGRCACLTREIVQSALATSEPDPSLYFAVA